MSALTDQIRDFGPEATAEALTAMPDMALFNLAWSTPAEIIPAVDALGLDSIDAVTAWTNRVNTAFGLSRDAFVALVDPPVTMRLQSMPTIDFAEVHKAIAAQCSLRDDFRIDQSDRTYRLPTKGQLEQLAATCPIKRRKWVADSNDCDDFVKGFLGWLAFNGLGNIAAGFCSITSYDASGAMVGGHAVVLAMDDSLKLWFIEPQNGRLYEPTYAKLGGYFLAKSVKLARVFF